METLTQGELDIDFQVAEDQPKSELQPQDLVLVKNPQDDYWGYLGIITVKSLEGDWMVHFYDNDILLGGDYYQDDELSVLPYNDERYRHLVS